MAITFNHNDQVYVKDGKLGIGTASPAQKLHIKSTTSGPTGIIIENTNNAQSLDLDFWSNAGSVQGRIRYNEGAGSFDISPNAGAGPAMTMLYNGNVGIGTTSPDHPLHLSSAATGNATNLKIESTSQYGGIAFFENASNRGTLAFGNDGNIFTGALTDSLSLRAEEALHLGAGGNNLSMTVATSGNVGIGTTSPGFKLQVGTPAVVSGSDYSWSFDLTRANSTSRGFSIGQADGGGVVVMGGHNTDMAFGHTFGTDTNGNPLFYETMRIQHVDQAVGNVGIGTSSPGYKLQVNGDAAFFSAAGSLNSIITQGSEGKGRFYLYDGGNATIALQTNAPSYFNAGNVGIGTTSPSEKLDVDGNIYAQNRIINADVSLSNKNLLEQTTIKISNLNDIYANAAKTVISEYEARYVNDNTSATTIRGNAVPGLVDGQLYTLSVYYKDLIGTISLDIGDTPLDGPYKSATGTSSVPTSGRIYGKAVRTNNAYEFIDINLSTGGSVTLLNPKLEEGSVVTEFIATSEEESIPQTITTNNLISTGNVGIGTTVPTNKLDVNHGNIGLYADAYASTGLLRLFGTDNAEKMQLGTFSDGAYIYTPANKYLSVYTGGSEKLRISSTGNVGIGTTNPLGKLHIENPDTVANQLALLVSQNDNAAAIANFYQLGVQAFSFTTTGTNSGVLLIKSGGSNVVQVSTSGHSYFNGGNVGIGTTSPGAKLEISGFSTGAGLKLNYGNSSGTIEAVNFIANGGANGVIGMQMVSAGVGDLWLGGSGGRSLTLYRDGNVGIGKTDPSAPLHINGGSTNQVVKIQSTTAPYVRFKEGGTDVGFIQFGTDSYISNQKAGTLNFRTNNTDKMTILSGGNVGIGTTSPTYKLNVVTNAVAGKQNLADIDKTAQNFITFTNPQYSADSSVGLLLRVFPQSDARQGAGIIASGGSNNATTDLDLFVTTSQDGLVGTSYSALKINGLNGNVGIGTTAPNAKLDVTGNTRLGSGTLHISTDQTFTTSFTYSFRDAVGILNPNGSSAAVATSVMSIGAMSNSTSLITTGNVGIGTSSPDRGLTISGSNGYAALNIYKANTTNQIVFLGTGSGGPEDDAILQLFDEATEKVRIFTTGNSWLNGGNVGIGTSSPSEKLDVAGAIALNGYLAIYSPNNGDDIYGNIRVLRNLHYTDGMYIGYDNAGGSNGHLRFYANGQTERMRIDASNGNVGIGTATPNSQLDAYTTEGGSKISTTHGTGGTYPKVSGISFGATSTSLTVSNNSGTTTFTGGAGIYANNSAATNNVTDLLFWTTTGGTPAERMRIDSAGNVGIGTTSPGYNLDVVGSIALGGSGHGLRFKDGGATTTYVNESWGININGDATHPVQVSSASLLVGYSAGGTNYGTDNLYVAGNVGIGTTSPETALQVIGDIGAGSGYNGGFYATADASNVDQNWGFDFSKTAGVDDYSVRTKFYPTANSARKVGFYDSSNNTWMAYFDGNVDSNPNFIISTGGNVGIGTSSPEDKLHIIGGHLLLNNALELRSKDTSGNIKTITRVNSSNELEYGWSGAGAVKFMGGGSYTERMRIHTNGNVGIGTTTPSYKLTVDSGTDDIGIVTASSDSGSYIGFIDNATSVVPKVGAVGNKLILDASQYVGVRRTDPSYALDVNGTIRATGDVIAYSDARVKENVETIPNALDKVKAMRGVGYNKIGEEKRSIGVIAQEMLEVMPEVVSQDEQGMYSVAYGNLVGVLIEAMKDQQKQIDELKAQLNGITK